MSARKIHITLDDAMLARVDELAAHEHRSRSELIREAIRRYGHSPAPDDSRRQAKVRALAALHAVAGASEGNWRQEAEFTTLEEYRQWRERLWSGTPRVVAESG